MWVILSLSQFWGYWMCCGWAHSTNLFKLSTQTLVSEKPFPCQSKFPTMYQLIANTRVRGVWQKSQIPPYPCTYTSLLFSSQNLLYYISFSLLPHEKLHPQGYHYFYSPLLTRFLIPHPSFRHVSLHSSTP